MLKLLMLLVLCGCCVRGREEVKSDLPAERFESGVYTYLITDTKTGREYLFAKWMSAGGLIELNQEPLKERR